LSRYCIFDLTGWCWNTFFSDISPLLESFTRKTFFLFFWHFHWSDEQVVLLMQMLYWFPRKRLQVRPGFFIQWCCSSSELSVCISTSLQHPGLSVFTARILNQQPNFKSISSEFTHGTNKVCHNVVGKWQQQDVSLPLKVCYKTEKAMEWIPEGSDSSRKLMNNLAVKRIMQVHKKGKIVRFTQSNYSPLNKIWKLPTMCVYVTTTHHYIRFVNSQQFVLM
jgi:hypothetical protein